MTKIQINHGTNPLFLCYSECVPSEYGALFTNQIFLLNLSCSGFGFVTYRTVEAAKKAIDDPNKMLGVSRIMHDSFPLLLVVFRE